MSRFKSLAISNGDDLMFGQAPKPLKTRQGMVIGGGTVYPEINFTLPGLTIDASTMPEVCRHYRQIVEGVLTRAAELEAPGVVVEFETLPPMTENPDWGMRIVDILLAGIQKAHDRHGLKAVLRMTPNDNREFIRPPTMRSGRYWEKMLELFDRSAAAGAELLSIESVGGKEIHDEALTMGDISQVIFALCVMGARDMEFLWTHLSAIAKKHNVHAAGDTACGFGNTAMVLAEQKMIPRVFAAVVRAVTAVRSLVAYECGAVGPGKDCGYENPILKAITGYPMAMEGKTAACAHLSPVGNLAAATCDLWSNESVQNIKLLGGMAPVCYMEQLIYDCRLMNQATAAGPKAALDFRGLLVDSDAGLDPQAYVISPTSALAIAQAIVGAPDRYHAGKAAALTAVNLLEKAHAAGELKLADRETPWLDMIRQSVQTLPDTEDAFISDMMATVDTTKFVAADYDLSRPTHPRSPAVSKATLTGQQRVNRMFKRQDQDRIPRHDSYWGETIKRWQSEGLEGDGGAVLRLLDSDFQQICWSSPQPYPGREEIIEEDEHTRVTIDGSGEKIRQWTDRSGTPEHLGWECDSRQVWQQTIKPTMLATDLHVNMDWAHKMIKHGRELNRWCYMACVEGFEFTRRLMGDVTTMIAMATEPDWVKDVSETHTDLMLHNLQAILDAGLQPDGVWMYGDMAYNHATMCSPAMYRDLIWPDHKRVADWAHAHNLPCIFHTDGDVNAVIDLYVQAGFDCLQPLEAKANMDIRNLCPRYGDRLAFFGNIDVMVMGTNDPRKIEHEVKTKLAAGMATKAYSYHSDHSVPPLVSWDTYRFIIDLLDRFGAYA